MTPDQIDKHARRIAYEVICSAIEDAAQDSLPEIIGYDEELETLDISRADEQAIHSLAYDYMMGSHVSVG